MVHDFKHAPLFSEERIQLRPIMLNSFPLIADTIDGLLCRSTTEVLTSVTDTVVGGVLGWGVPDEYVYVHFIAVRPTDRQQSVGRQLLQEFERTMQGLYSPDHIEADVVPIRVPWFEKQGYVLQGYNPQDETFAMRKSF